MDEEGPATTPPAPRRALKRRVKVPGRYRWLKPDEWEPPRIESHALCVGIDPPGAWCMWGRYGVLASGVADNELLAGEQMFKVYDSTRRITYACIEKPWGVAQPGFEQSIIRNALAAGWWRRALAMPATHLWAPTASQWRRWLGIYGNREQVKRQAVRLATELAEMQADGTPPPKNDNEAEARLMGMAAWLRAGCTVYDDLTHRWMVRFGVPYTEPNLTHKYEVEGTRYKIITGHGMTRRVAGRHAFGKDDDEADAEQGSDGLLQAEGEAGRDGESDPPDEAGDGGPDDRDVHEAGS